MGSRYAEGRGVPQNLQEAARWLERAANAGFVPAQFRLAGLNEKGEGVKKDLQAARRLYLAAANKGHAKAMHNLAVLHAEGFDGKPDYKVAAQWFRKAAAYGIADSQYNLAILYARGIGVEANLGGILQVVCARGRPRRPGRRQEARRGGGAARPADPDGGEARGADLRRRARARRGDEPQGAAGRLGSGAGARRPNRGRATPAASAR